MKTYNFNIYIRLIGWISAICLFGLTFNSCRGDIDFKPKNTEDILSMNARLDASKEKHEIELFYSGVHSIKKVKNGKVKLYVNDQVADEIDYAAIIYNAHTDSYDGTEENKTLHAKFKTGDHVKIEATVNGKTISAEGVIPSVPTIEEVTNSGEGSCKFNWDTYICDKFTLKLNDTDQSKNFYRASSTISLNNFNINEEYEEKVKNYLNEHRLIGDQAYEQCVELFKGKKKEEYLKEEPSKSIVVELSNFNPRFHEVGLISDDPVIRDKVNEQIGQDIMGYFPNFYNLFSDNMFNGSIYNLKLCIPKEVTKDALNNWRTWDKHSEYEGKVIPFMIEYNVNYAITSMDEDTFRYYKVLNIMSSEDYDDEDVFVEPIVQPSNVKDGYGFVMFCNSISYPMPKKFVLATATFSRHVLYKYPDDLLN